MISEKKFINLEVPSMPCHSQSVERDIKLVKETTCACDPQNREGYILNKLKFN